MTLPPVSLVRQYDTHRLVPSRHLPNGDSVLVRLAEDVADLQAVFELDGATNDRLLAEHQRLPGIGVEELVFGVPHAAVVNATFCHAHPLGARFNGPDRGAWYAAFDVATSQAEVAFHKSVQLAEIGRFEDVATYDDYLADFSAAFHDLRRARGARAWLAPELRGVAGTRGAAARGGIARRGVPERAARGRDVRRVLPSGARGQRAPREALPVHVGGKAGAAGDAGALAVHDHVGSDPTGRE
jgi:hypothetical protein